MHIFFYEFSEAFCDAPMGLENRQLKDEQITASTYYNSEFNPHNGRLERPQIWSPLTLNDNQYLEVDNKEYQNILQVTVVQLFLIIVISIDHFL